VKAYTNRARLIEDISSLEQYDRVLSMDKIKEGETHWNSLGKSTITLIQVLIDQDLTHLVMVLEKYPGYIEAVCEHFRYAYSYSENEANLFATSKLLDMGRPHFTKQFVRNVVRKLPKIDMSVIEEVKEMSEFLAEHKAELNEIILNHYGDIFTEKLKHVSLHPLQRIALAKGIEKFHIKEVYNYQAEDRDAALDIPYMN